MSTEKKKKIIINQGRDFEYTIFLIDKNGIPVSIVGWTLIEIKHKNTDGSILRLRSPLTAKVDEVQQITFSEDPTGGTFVLDYGNGQVTAAINWDDDAATVQAKINALNIFSAVVSAGVIDQATGLTTTFGGDDGAREQPVPIVTDNLEPASVDITVARTTKGIAETGSTVISAERGEIKVKGSEVQSPLLLAGEDQTMVPIVRVADKDLNIEPQENFYDVKSDPLA